LEPNSGFCHTPSFDGHPAKVSKTKETAGTLFFCSWVLIPAASLPPEGSEDS
jgi:hypothetical protein